MNLNYYLIKLKTTYKIHFLNLDCLLVNLILSICYKIPLNKKISLGKLKTLFLDNFKKKIL